MKTADIERSKRLKELGWSQKSECFWVKRFIEHGGNIIVSTPFYPYKDCFEVCSAPIAGEMIEWLFKKNHILNLCNNQLDIIYFDREDYIIRNSFLIFANKENSLENALADACIFILEEKKNEK